MPSRIVADLSLDKAILQDVLSKSFGAARKRQLVATSAFTFP
ncbi:hypothetical protein [Rhizobium gallicum]|nr:hypothetical protein [Rhizobium gallicum]